MRTAVLLFSFALGVLAAPLAGQAQQPARLPRIGFLGKVVPDHLTTFRQGLAEAGYVEGQNIAIEYRPVVGQYASDAADLVRLKVDVIVAVGPAALRGAARATKTIPIVAIDLESDPVESGFAASLSRPGGNITGSFLDTPELMGKWLELVKETVPGLSRVAALWDPAQRHVQLEAAKAAARSLALQLQTVEVRGPDDLERALAATIPGRPEALIQLPSPLTFFGAKQIAGFASKHRLPSISMFREFPEAGGLIAYGPNLADLFERCGTYTARVLKGASPGGLPIERPAKFELIINLKTATALGLTISQSLLVRADEIIK